MKIFISYSHKDQKTVDLIRRRLQNDGHEVWSDSKIKPGDSILPKIQDALLNTDALIVVISENSFRSKWVQYEFSALALQQISNREARIIPVRIDQSSVPSYLSDRLYLDLSEDFQRGLDRLSESLQAVSLAAIPDAAERLPEDRSTHIKSLREARHKGRLTLVCGAGVSVEAGIPAWNDLLIKLLETVMKRISKDHSLDLGRKTAADFQKRIASSSLILGKYLKNNLGREFQSEVRDALYATNPKSSNLIDQIVELARPQRDGKPLDSIVTFNFDCLIEEGLVSNRIAHKAIHSEAKKHDANELPVYHVHGFLPRTGKIPADTELVFSEDTYHDQFIDPFSWSNLIQLNKLTQNTCLYVGIGLTDPNMRRLLDVAWRKNPDKMMSHYIVRKLPRHSSGDVLDEVSKLLEEQDANGLGLNVVWIDDFSELAQILTEISKSESH